jgi:anthranilate synthase/aminodeoxychorismate synthase-like glutamine amidotransferase
VDVLAVHLQEEASAVILIIDNYDSFTYNLYQYCYELGTTAQVVRNDRISLQEIADLAPEKIIISPGPCTPNEAGISLAVIERFGPTTPLLGVCLGHQAIGQAFGGKIIRAPKPVHGKTEQIHHDSVGIFAEMANPFTATRYHSLIVERTTLPASLEVTAWTNDGLIMGLRHREYPIEGVQFHPESILTTDGKQLLQHFLEATPCFVMR